MNFKRNLLASIAMVSMALVQAPSARAGIGIFLATSHNDTTRIVGDVLIAVGVGTTLVGVSSGPSRTVACTPSNPCQVYDGNYANNSYSYSQGYYYGGYAPYGDYCYSNGDCYSNQYSGAQSYKKGEAGIIIAGLVLLGTDAAPEVSFKPLTEQSATEMKINSSEAKAFNAELAQINLLTNDFMSRLMSEARSGRTDAQSKSDAAVMWNSEAKPVLSAEAFSAVQKSFSAYGAVLTATAKK